MAAVEKKGILKLKRERRDSKYRESLAKETGICFSPDLTAEREGFPYIKYIVNALILFCSSFGSIYCFITAFELQLNIIPAVFACALASLVFSFMYAGKRAKIAVYLVILFLIIALGTTFYSVVNSGVSALRNHTLSYIDTHSNLPFLREFNTYFSDDYVSMSVAAAVIGVALTMILNIFVSEKMSLLALFLITFPITQFGMYFDYKVSKTGMLLVVSGWVLVAAVKLTNAYNGLTVKMISKSSVKKHKHSYGFVTDSKNVAQIALVLLSTVLIVTGLVFAVIPQESFDIALPTDALKSATERPVKNFLSYGLSSLFSPTSSGGEPGRLSNVANVSYDGMTDLKVRVINYRADRIYLRQYVGTVYEGDNLRWVNRESNVEYPQHRFNYTAEILKEDFEGEQFFTQSEHRMTIRIVDPNLMREPLAVPYYALVDKDGSVNYSGSGEVHPVSSEGADKAQEYTFYTVDKPNEDYSGLIDLIEDEEKQESFSLINEMMSLDAQSDAFDVPERNIPAIKEFCETYGISADDEDVTTEVIKALEDNFTYTLQPGKIPYGEDYVNYFLLANMKGYCQHFATAATLIFRYLGIPARYAEGYVINREDFYMGKDLTDEKKEDWITTPYSSDNFPTEIDVPDSSGHAWVEIYKEGLGWQVIEATTAPSDDSGLPGLAGIFRNNPFSNASRNIIDGVRKINTERTKSAVFRLFIITVCLLALAYFVRMAYKVIRRHRGFNTKNMQANLSNRYLQLKEVFIFANGNGEGLSYKEFFSILLGRETLGEMPPDLADRFEKALFSGDEISAQDYSTLTGYIKTCLRDTVKSMKAGRKLKYYLVNILW